MTGWLLVTPTILVALAFDYTNGFHDSANAIATSVSTRALSFQRALGMAALFNLLGAFVSTHVAETIGSGIVPPNEVTPIVVFSALVGAITWNLITWYYGLPSSSSHALIGGLVGGASFSHGLGAVNWNNVLLKILLPTLLSPMIGLLLGFSLMVAIYRIFRNSSPGPLNQSFRVLQTVSASLVAFSHGSNDAQKTMGIITLALMTGGLIPDFHVPLWVVFLAATAMASGTLAGGWRIIRTLGVRVIKLEPVHGFAAETTAFSVIMTTALLGFPISTTHVISSAIMGVGASRRFSAVRWGVAGDMFTAWILTFPMAALLSALTLALLRPIFG